MMMMTHKVDDHLGVDGRARKTQARHHRVSWTCFCSERRDGFVTCAGGVLVCEARVSLGMVVVGDGRLMTTTSTLVKKTVGGRSCHFLSRYVGTSKEDYSKVGTYLHLSLALFPALLPLDFFKKSEK